MTRTELLRSKGADLWLVTWSGTKGPQSRTVWGEEPARRMVRILAQNGIEGTCNREQNTTTTTPMQTKAAGWRRGICPTCGSDVVANIKEVNGQFGSFHECMGVKAGTCDHRIKARLSTRLKPATLPDGRRYWKAG